MTQDRNCISFWLPKLIEAGLPVPKTELVRMPSEALESIYHIMDGKLSTGARPFLHELTLAVEKMRYPCFLRTGHTAGKHEWNRTCYVTIRAQIFNHVIALIEHSALVDMIGLPCDVWAVREFLPIQPLATCPRFGGMPVCREYRTFVEDGNIRCVHPYWPREALQQGGLPNEEAARIADVLLRPPLTYTDPTGHCFALARRAGEAVGGAWSVDLLETARGWYVIDMAEADRSWHWEGCPHAPKAAQQEVTRS